MEQHLVGAGKERNCFVHPDHPDKAIKVVQGSVTKQTDREIKFYRTLQRRKNVSHKHIPFYFGKINTNFGSGHMFQMVRDYDGDISKPLLWYLKEGYDLEKFDKQLEELRQYLIANHIIFNHDMYAGNILYMKESTSKGRLIIIDGLGDTVFLTWLNAFPSHRISKINRRWKLFIDRLRGRAVKWKEEAVTNKQ